MANSNPYRRDLHWLKRFLIGYDFVLLIISAGYFGIRQTRIFTDNSDQSPFPLSRRRYEKSGLRDDKAIRIMEKVKAKMEDDKLYRDPELSLSLLAKSLQENSNHLSQAINEQNGRTFHDLINHYRVMEFQSRISEAAEKKERFFLLRLSVVLIQNQHSIILLRIGQE